MTILYRKIRYERQTGKLIPAYVEWGGDRRSESRLDDQTLKLKDLNITKFQSHRYQTIASIEADLFEQKIQEIKDNPDNEIEELDIKWKRQAKEHEKLSQGRGKKGCQNSDNLFDPIDRKKMAASYLGTSHDTYAKADIYIPLK